MFRPLTARADLPSCGRARICVVRSRAVLSSPKRLNARNAQLSFAGGTSLLPRSEEIPGQKLPAFVAGRTFSVVPARYKNVPPGKAQHFADNFQSVTGNRLIISDKSRPRPHCRMPEIRGFWNACRVNVHWTLFKQLLRGRPYICTLPAVCHGL